jgi:hypothetical protein
MLTVFFDVKGTVRREFVPTKMTVNSDFYCDVLRRLRENMPRKKPELWRNHNWVLHHDNAPAHTSLKTTEFFTNNNMIIVPHPPYSPDLAPCDFALFPKLKMKLKGRDDVLKQCLTSKGNRKRCSKAFRTMTSTVLLKRGKNDGIVVYVPKETILKETAAKIE